MQLNLLLRNITVKEIYGEDRMDIKGIGYDSRNICQGYVFVCIEGFNTDGHKYADHAVENGAAAVVMEKDVDVPSHVTRILVKDTRKALAQIAKSFFNNIDESVDLIGVTGTNGKTSTTFLIKSILESSGRKAGLIGTIKNIAGDVEIEAIRTTPESSDLFRLFRDMKDKGVDSVVMEVSSHSLDLKRVEACVFSIGIFTNLTREHLDFHDNMENYYLSKKKLFNRSKMAIINVDDSYGRRLVKEVGIPVTTFSIENQSDVKGEDINITARGSDFVLSTEGVRTSINLKIPGNFSIYNALAAAACCYRMGISPEYIKKGLEAVKCVPGRFEVLDTDTPYTVLIDYAHTPDGLENILKTVRSFAKGRVITLFGAGGDRDATKRSLMGEIASRYSDYCIITSDNPRTEDSMSIIRQVEKGVTGTKCEYSIVENRKEAIYHALKKGMENDVIILAGKGHETYQVLKEGVIEFDEKKIVCELLREENF